jgi:hypothetical protein
MNLDLKTKLHIHIESLVLERMNRAETELQSLQTSVFEETKSTSGDKHETARAMGQIEVEKATKVLLDALQLKRMLEGIDPTKQSNEAILGALIQTKMGWFYLSISIGKIEFEKNEIFCIGMTAPYAQHVLKMKTGNRFTFRSQEDEILQII